ncbi:ribonuclease BN [Flavipsychrobacter stenotrophus]|uniref:Ribonuclease BN n=1 Tax=Flavipsychrobacter stenotrophus TaxID=2077091 RepID=A0A2S7SVY2_9BACT|nr:YihY/virulence factor BrkB family protein [Flavipsychrobacter stenotrophus]PQJ10894.1 ribonuclease BN [Flavipsychrobacter stenotrophus]
MAFEFRKYFHVLKEAGIEFANDNGTKLSASLAYYTIFSIGPLLLVVISVSSIFYKRADITTKILDQVSALVGTTGADQIRTMLDNTKTQGNTTLFSIIGIVVLIFGATGIFTEIQSSINYIWSIKAKPKKGWLKYITDRLLSFSLIIGSGFLMLVTLLINLLMDILSDHLQRILGDANIILLKGLNIGLLFVVVTFLFAVIYKVLPDAVIKWKDALVGAAFTGVLFLIGKFLIGYYLGASKSISTYGAAASLILLLSWVYYSSIILYFGAEFTKVYALRLGSGITVYDTAVYIVKREAKEHPEVKHPHM